MFLNPATLENLQSELLSRDLPFFAPELILCGAIVLLLLLRLLNAYRRRHLGPLALLCTLAALAVSVLLWQQPNSSGVSQWGLFSGLLISDNFTVFVRTF